MKTIAVSAMMLMVVLAFLLGCSTLGAAGVVSETDSSTATTVPLGNESTAAEENAAGARVSVSFVSDVVAEGETTEAVVAVAGVDDLYGVELHLAFSAEQLEVVDIDDATEGTQISDGDLLVVAYTVLNQADNEAGTVDYAVSQMPPKTGVTGAGDVACIELRAKAAGTAELKIAGVLLADSTGSAIPASFDSGGVKLTVQ